MNIKANNERFTKIEMNKKDVGAECRHDMRPFVQLPSVSGVDSKLGLAMVRPSLQSVPEPPALDPPPVSKHVRQTFGVCQTALEVFDVR